MNFRLIMIGTVAFLLGGCHTFQMGREVARHPQVPGVPIASVREDFEAAKAEDPALMLGFFSAPFVGDFSTGTGDTPTAAPGEAAEERRLIETLQATVAPDTWSRPGRTAFRKGPWLVVFQSEEVLKSINPWLDEYSGQLFAERGMVSTQLTVLTSTDGAGVLQEVLGLAGVPSKTTVFPLSNAQKEKLLQHDGLQTVTSPAITLLSGQRGNVTVATECAYVEDYEIFYVDDMRVADPVIATVHDGITADLRTTLDRGSNAIDVELSVALSNLEGMTDTQIAVGDETMTIQLPQLASVTTTADFRQLRGNASLVTGPEIEGQRLFVLVSTD